MPELLWRAEVAGIVAFFLLVVPTSSGCLCQRPALQSISGVFFGSPAKGGHSPALKTAQFTGLNWRIASSINAATVTREGRQQGGWNPHLGVGSGTYHPPQAANAIYPSIPAFAPNPPG